MELLRVENLKKVYNTKMGFHQCVALREVSFEVAAGEFVAVMGASGSGKTTLLNLIASLDRPSGGRVFLEGQNIAEIRDKQLCAFRRDHLGFVFQDFNLLDTFTLRDNILLPLVLQQLPRREMEPRLTPIARMLGIGHLLDKYPVEVSGGEKQRAAVARAVITNPRLLLADEPTGALDSRASANLLNIFCDLNRQGQTIVMVTHSAFAASHASRVMMIKDGMLFNQFYRGESTSSEFFDRIVSNLSVLTGGGAVDE